MPEIETNQSPRDNPAISFACESFLIVSTSNSRLNFIPIGPSLKTAVKYSGGVSIVAVVLSFVSSLVVGGSKSILVGFLLCS